MTGLAGTSWHESFVLVLILTDSRLYVRDTRCFGEEDEGNRKILERLGDSLLHRRQLFSFLSPSTEKSSYVLCTPFSSTFCHLDRLFAVI